MLLSMHDFILRRRVAVKTDKEEKIRNEIDNSLKAIREMLPGKRWSGKHHIRPYFVSFEIPGTKNEAFLHIDGMRDEEVMFRLDVSRKGTRRAYSHYLKSCTHYAVEYYLYNLIDREEIYKSIVSLSKKVDEYWDKH